MGVNPCQAETKKIATFLKNIWENIWWFQEKFVPLQHSCKNNIEQLKLRHNYRVNFS